MGGNLACANIFFHAACFPLAFSSLVISFTAFEAIYDMLWYALAADRIGSPGM
jgi:hypothetical protein